MSRHSFAPLLALLLLAQVALMRPAGAAQPFSFAATPGNLPKTAFPRHYEIDLTPNLMDMTTSGAETIQLDVLTPTPTLVCNIRSISVSGATVDGRAAAFVNDDKAETVTVRPDQPLTTGPHTLGLTFAGHISDSPQGLFFIRYKDPDGTPKTMLATQMEATDARRMFPCWDEPVYRATYQLNVTVPQDFKVVSNMPQATVTPVAGGLKTVRFPPTPPMASYLTALVMGDLESVSGTTSDGIPVSVVTTRGKKASAEYALSVIEKVLPYYDDYFGIKYPLPKMDLIAVPGGLGQAAAMENWGAIIYAEFTILYDPTSVNPDQQRFVFQAISHETAHQWFGDLVTMAWWDDLWLNEGFASWMDLKATDHFDPAPQASPDFDSRSYVMDSDTRPTAHAIQQHLTDPKQIDQAFDDITYFKGENVIRMVEDYLGPDTFRKGIRAYIAAHKYSSTTTQDLWDALSKASGQPVGVVAGTFTTQPGYPLVTAGVECRGGKQTLTLSQTRFHLAGDTPPAEQWQIPVMVSTPAAVGRPAEKPRPVTVGAGGVVLPAGACGTPVIVNAGDLGYYRVKYVGPLWEAVKKAAPTLAPDDQLALLNDRWALVQADQGTTPEYLDLVQTLRNDDQLIIWPQIFGALSQIGDWEIGDPHRDAFHASVAGLLRPLAVRLGRDARPGEDAVTASLRPLVLATLGNASDPDTLAWARDRFAAFVKDRNAVPPALRGTVLTVVGHSADQTTYGQLHALGIMAAQDDKPSFYNAMASAHDPKLAQQTLALALSDELPAPSNVWLIDTVAVSGEQPEAAWAFFQAHRSEIKPGPDASVLNSVEWSLIGAFPDPARVEELLTQTRAGLSPDARPAFDRYADSDRTEEALKKRELPRVDAWLGSSLAVSPANSPSAVRGL
jgi:aminopeptidase N